MRKPSEQVSVSFSRTGCVAARVMGEDRVGVRRGWFGHEGTTQVVAVHLRGARRVAPSMRGHPLACLDGREGWLYDIPACGRVLRCFAARHGH